MDHFKNKKILVTGGSGFFASHLVHALIEAKAKVILMTKYNSVIDNIRLAKFWDQMAVLEADLRNLDSLRALGEVRPEIVFHFAAYNHVGDSFLHVQEAINSNSLGTSNLLEAYSKFKKFIYISTSEVYGHQKEVPFHEGMTPFPISPYAVGKYSGELYSRMVQHVKKLPITVIRPFNVFGPYQSPRAIIAEIIIKCLRGEPILATEGVQTRDFNFVKNLVEGTMLAAASESTNGEVINLGSGEEITIKELILKIHRLTGSRSKLAIGELPYRPTEIWRMAADNKKAKQLLGWTPRVSFEEAIVQTIDWYRYFLRVYSDPTSPLLQL